MKLPYSELHLEAQGINDNCEEITSEIKLWRAVIQQNLEDLVYRGNSKKKLRWKQQALEWLNQTNEDLYLVCEYAQISPNQLLKLAQHLKSL
jgi:methionyl-tRNA formyltransferase